MESPQTDIAILVRYLPERDFQFSGSRHCMCKAGAAGAPVACIVDSAEDSQSSIQKRAEISQAGRTTSFPLATDAQHHTCTWRGTIDLLRSGDTDIRSSSGNDCYHFRVEASGYGAKRGSG